MLVSGLVFLTESTKANYTEDFDDGDFRYRFLDGDEYNDSVIINRYLGNEAIVIIPETVQYEDKTYTVTDIGGYSFYVSQGIQQVQLPNTIKRIWPYAFEGTTVESINLPSGLLEIGHYAFSGSKLEHIDLPDSLERIYEGAFSGTNLSTIDIPNKITKIEESTFEATNLTEVVIPSNVKEIGEGAFSGCNIEKIVFSEGLTSISPRAFRNNKIKELEFPESLNVIAFGAFTNNEISQITFSENENLIIYTMAFSDNQLTNVTLPNIEVLDWGVFQGNDITNIFLEDDEMLDIFSTHNSLYGANKETKIINIHAPSFTNAEYQGTEQTYTIDKGENINLGIEADALYQQISRYDDRTNTYDLVPEINGATYPYTGKTNFVPEVQWYKDGVAIAMATDKHYSEVIDIEGTFIYYAIVNGEVLDNIQVTVKENSMPMINPDISNISNQNKETTKNSDKVVLTNGSMVIGLWSLGGVVSIVGIYYCRKKHLL